jgi:glycosyltransferase involved in cell wall biosynthesis
VAWEQAALPALLREHRIDLLHAPGYVAPLLSRIPTVLTVHDLFYRTHPDVCTRLNRWHYRLLQPASTRRARRVVTFSSAVQQLVCEQFRLDDTRVSVLKPGLDPAFSRPATPAAVAALRRRLGLARDFVLFVGNPEPKKNLPRLLRALELLRQRGLDLELVLAGTGTRASWGCDGVTSRRLRALGYVPSEDMPALYGAATVVAFPSLVEGFGTPPIEAMACGTPVVCSAVPSVTESDPEAALQVDPRDPCAIAWGLARAVEDSELRASLIARGHLVAAAHSWSSHARALWRLYSEAMRAD